MALSQPRQSLNSSARKSMQVPGEGDEGGEHERHPMEGKKTGSGGNVATVMYDKLVCRLLISRR